MSTVRKLGSQLVKDHATSATPATLQLAIAYPAQVVGAHRNLNAHRHVIDDDTLDRSVETLDRASKNAVFLLERYQLLDDYARKLEAWSKDQIAHAEGTVEFWHDAALRGEADLQAAHDALEAVQKRAEIAEEAIVSNAQTLNALVERIDTVFGSGSEANDVMLAIEAV